MADDHIHEVPAQDEAPALSPGPPPSVGARLKAAREAKGLSLTQIAS